MVDLRVTVFDVPTQQLLTRDSVPILVDAVVYYRIASRLHNQEPHSSTYLLAQTFLRNSLGLHALSTILSDVKLVENRAVTMLNTLTIQWGFEVTRIEIKDIRLPATLCRKMAAEEEALREAAAKLIAANGELQAILELAKATGNYANCPVTMQLRQLHLDTMPDLADSKSHVGIPAPY
ncbi:hypothetical protein WR25_12254 [Diploscapter pachys]|uniref:Band 7 domain-containing protein n=1 Tax=Diploscapter pachys TaxID=2018661 RepID=A0A2A2LEJ1_9BILA|nr:hypothetical protein WR25_12254 [Diploscapter pachys]